MTHESKIPASPEPKLHPFRRAVLRGLAVVMPAILTVVLFIWAWSLIEVNVLRPIESAVNAVIYQSVRQVQSRIPDTEYEIGLWVQIEAPDGTLKSANSFFHGTPPPTARDIAVRAKAMGGRIAKFEYRNVVYVPITRNWIPEEVYEAVAESPGSVVLATASEREIYNRYIKIRYLQRWKVIPIFLVLFVCSLYLVGKFLAAGVGRILWNSVEGLIQRLPIIRNVYSSVKQVTDFVFTEQEIEFNRVVAVEYPRKGVWSIGFVTGESLLDIRSAANEPVLSVLMPTSPMPATGFTITVRKSETIDLNMTIDQAIQMVVSCGVVVPRHQQSKNDVLESRSPGAITRRIANASSDNGQATAGSGRTSSGADAATPAPTGESPDDSGDDE